MPRRPRGKDIDETSAERIDDGCDIAGMFLGGALVRAIGAEAASGAARVVVHDQSIGESCCESGESAGVHRRSTEQERVIPPQRAAHVVGDPGAGPVHGARLDVRHTEVCDLGPYAAAIPCQSVPRE